MDPQPLAALRLSRWATIPTSPGVYWWYFPASQVDRLRICELCDLSRLRLRGTDGGGVCLYHGLASNLAQRVEWHATQKLTMSSLQSGFLSTFRLTLLALNDFDYLEGGERIDAYFDTLSIVWRATSSRKEAEAIEHAELQGPYHYPLNIQGNARPELAAFGRQLKAARKAYRLRYLTSNPPIDASSTR